MKKRVLALIFVLLLCFSCTLPAAAEAGFQTEYARFSDSAGLLSTEQAEALLNRLNSISTRQQMDVIVVTTNDLENRSTATELADDIYDQCGFGYGESKDGLLLLISMQDRDWAISTCGSAITTFTDAGIDYIGEKITPSLSSGDYAAAFNTFADLCDDFITKAKTGTPYTSRTLPKEPLSPIYIPVAIAIGLVLALIIVGCMKAKLKSVHFKAAANSYVKSGSLNVTESSDLFLYNTVTRTEKPKDNDSGGSSTHTSSSGTTHGGGSGKF